MSNNPRTSKCRVLFTAPWDLEFKRRGDALGLRALADEFAEAVAPGLTNRVNDGRWVTILAWCLVRSQEVFEADYGSLLATAVEQRHRYEWLRPLELMWVARTIELTEDDTSGRANRAMSGQNSVRRWRERGQNLTDQFGMSEDQFRAYRQTGMYGGYRVAFRRWPGMTKGGDGWTPAGMAIKLANWLNTRLGKAGLQTYDGDRRKPKLGASAWWLKHWRHFNVTSSISHADTYTLPRPRDQFTMLPSDEADILREVIFGIGRDGKTRIGSERDGQRRFDIAKEVERSRAMSHWDVCKHLATTFSGDNVIVDLARFSQLADAGMAAMTLIAESLKSEPPRLLRVVAVTPKAAAVCKELHEAALEWLRGVTNKPSSLGFIHRDKATAFAKKIQSADPNECLQTLLDHHEKDGGGLLWFVLRDGQIEPRTLPSNRTASPYRFRLWSLCRLAAQCGVIRQIPKGIREDAVESDDDAE